MPTNREKQVIFAIAPAGSQPDGVPVLILMMPEAGWDHMRGGRSHDFDLTSIGTSLKLILGRCRDHAHGMELLKPYLGDAKVKDIRESYMGIGKKPDA